MAASTGKKSSRCRSRSVIDSAAPISAVALSRASSAPGPRTRIGMNGWRGAGLIVEPRSGDRGIDRQAGDQRVQASIAADVARLAAEAPGDRSQRLAQVDDA